MTRRRRKKYKEMWWRLVQNFIYQFRAHFEILNNVSKEAGLTVRTEADLLKDALIYADDIMKQRYRWWKVRHPDPMTPEDYKKMFEENDKWMRGESDGGCI